MIRVHVFVEGQTEETFVRELVQAPFASGNVAMNPILIRTGPFGKGGVVSYAKVRWQIQHKCREDRSAWVTTMIDLFRLPNDFPGMSRASDNSDPIERAIYLEREFGSDIGESNFIPNFIVHEYEALLFTDPDAFSNWFLPSAANELKEQRQLFKTPEYINDNPQGAPSKRILKCCEAYQKRFHGAVIAMDIGLEAIRQECSHFDAWLDRLARLAE